MALTDISDLKALTQLKYLDLTNARKIPSLEALSSLTTLETLYVSNNEYIETLDSLESLLALEELRLTNPDKANEYNEKAFDICEETNDTKTKAHCIINFGRYYAAINNYEEAVNRYNTALKLYQVIFNNKGISKALYYIGHY